MDRRLKFLPKIIVGLEKKYEAIVQIREALLNGSFFNPEKLVADSIEDIHEAEAIVAQLGDGVTEESLILLQKYTCLFKDKGRICKRFNKGRLY